VEAAIDEVADDVPIEEDEKAVVLGDDVRELVAVEVIAPLVTVDDAWLDTADEYFEETVDNIEGEKL
jgi:hypothetical protein